MNFLFSIFFPFSSGMRGAPLLAGTTCDVKSGYSVFLDDGSRRSEESGEEAEEKIQT